MKAHQSRADVCWRMLTCAERMRWSLATSRSLATLTASFEAGQFFFFQGEMLARICPPYMIITAIVISTRMCDSWLPSPSLPCSRAAIEAWRGKEKRGSGYPFEHRIVRVLFGQPAEQGGRRKPAEQGGSCRGVVVVAGAGYDMVRKHLSGGWVEGDCACQRLRGGGRVPASLQRARRREAKAQVGMSC